MSQNRWLATGNFFTTYREEQRIFLTHLDRMIFIGFLVLVFAWPLFFKVGNKYMLVIDNILIAIVAIYGLNLLTGFAGLISIGHAAFVGVGAMLMPGVKIGEGSIVGPLTLVLEDVPDHTQYYSEQTIVKKTISRDDSR